MLRSNPVVGRAFLLIALAKRIFIVTAILLQIIRANLRVSGRWVLANLHAFPTWIGAIVAVVGGIVAIIQYLENSTGSRAKEALEYVNHYFNPPISTAVAEVNLFGKKHE